MVRGNGRAPANGQTALVAAGQTFVEAADVGRMADELIGRYPIEFGHLHNHSISYRFRTGGRFTEGESAEVDRIAGVTRAPASWRADIGYDARLWVREHWWNRLDPKSREALVMHHLLHFSTTDKGDLRVGRTHDVTEFALVVRVYGVWLKEMEEFGGQLLLHLEGAPA